MINGIDYLKRMYPDRDEKDYQPAGLDLRLGQVYHIAYEKNGHHYGIDRMGKSIPPHVKARETELEYFKDSEKIKVIGWELQPQKPYICEVQEQIKIGEKNAQFYLPRSTLLRAGVNVYTALGDLGYNGHLSFLVINHGSQEFFIEKGERFAQLVDFQVRGGSESYNGDYQEKEVIADDWAWSRIQF